MFDASKRKNDEKRKPLSRRHIMVRVGLSISLIVLLLWILVRSLSYRGDSRPTGQVIYVREDGVTPREVIAVNLQTGERGLYEPTPLPDAPAAPIDYNTSTDGQWHTNWVSANPDGKTPTSYLEITNSETQTSYEVGPIYADPAHFWSPDSQSLFLIALPHPFTEADYDGHSSELWRVDLPTQQLIRLTNNSYMEHSPHASPDSKKLAYIGPVDGYSRLHIMDVATAQSILPTPDMFIFFGAWSPDSQWYAFETNHANGISDIWITRADGTETQPIALEPDVWERTPLWLP